MPGPSRYNRKLKARNDARKTAASKGGRTASEAAFGRSQKAAGRAVSATNLQAPKPKKVKAVRQPSIIKALQLPQVQDRIEALRTKYADSGRTKSQEQLGENLALNRETARREQNLKNATVRNKLDDGVASNRYEASKVKREVAAATRLNAAGTRVELLDGMTQLGNENRSAVQKAADQNKIKRQGNQFTTPRVRRVQRQVKKAKRQLAKAKRKALPQITSDSLNPDQERFAAVLAKRTGLDPGVVGAWLVAEQGGPPGDEYSAKGYYNFLNIGPFMEHPRFRTSPTDAANFTADSLLGKSGGLSMGAGIPGIVPNAKGRSPQEQAQVILGSGWGTTQIPLGSAQAKPANTKAVRKAQAKAASIGERAAEIGLRPQGLLTGQQMKELGLKPPEESGAPPKAVKSFKGMIAAAKELEALQMPYVLGGGHVAGAVGDPRQYPGLDCSSTVSHILQSGGVNMPTIVSGDFGSYTKPGPGAVTILYNPEHVLMKIGTQYFGTSGTNPSGGPGWIDKSVGDSQMASGDYNIGHVPGLGPKIAKQMNLDPESYRVFPGMKIEGNTATATSGTVSYSPTFSSTPILAGNGPASKKRRQTSVLEQLRKLGYNITSSGIRRSGLADSYDIKAPESISTIKSRYGVK